MQDYLTSKEVGRRLGITPRQVQRLARQGRIPFIRQGRIIRVPVLAWDTWVEKQAREALAAVKGETTHAIAEK